MLPSSDPGALRAFLDDPSRPADMLRYHELQGFLFTIVCAPELVPPSEWLPIIFGEEEAGFATPDEAQEILGQIMALYNAINGSVLESPARLPEDCRLRTSALANLDDDAPIAQWSRGFIRGHDWLSDDWDAYLPDELDEEFHATFMPLTFFASRQMAEDFAAESSEHTLDGLAEAMASVFTTAVAQYARMGRTIASVLAEYDAEPARSIKIGRNDPCPCGSGKKYKKCCGATVH